jgi:hypothetical protein
LSAKSSTSVLKRRERANFRIKEKSIITSLLSMPLQRL